MRWTGVAVLVAAAGLALWTPASVIAKKPRQIAASAQTQFGLDMYKVMADSDKSSNMFFSPLSICTALAMTFAGSNGETSSQMADVLHFNERRPVIMRGHRGLLRLLRMRYGDDIALRITNRLYTARRMRVRRRFSSYLSHMFGANVTRMAFNRPLQAAKLINQRVSEDTQGAIDSLIQPSMLSAQTRLILVNAVYFKGDWLLKFDPADTVPGTFHTPDGPRPVEMMQASQPFAVGRLPALKSRVLVMPYKGKKIHMMVVLPHRRNGMQLLERGLAKTSLADIFEEAKIGRKVDVKMPKFKLDERIDLKRVLVTMGMKHLFDAGKANLTRISRRGRLYVTDAIHKAVIDVNEEGSEASAATAIRIGYRRLGPKPPPFVVDRPFFFAIYDAGSDLTLFMGRVMNPTV